MKLTRKQAEQLLVENGLKPTAPDEEIRSALIKANWHEDDVEMALIVLRENIVTHETHLDAAHNLFRGTTTLDAKAINGLLGIDIEITKDEIQMRKKVARGAISYSQVMEIALVSFAISAIFLFGGMWLLKVGMFHQTVI